MRRSRPWTESAACDRGSASLEFLTVGMILLVPLVYLVLAVAAIQAAALGVDGAARQASRVAVLRADDAEPATVGVERTVRVVLADYGVDIARRRPPSTSTAPPTAISRARASRCAARCRRRLPLVQECSRRARSERCSSSPHATHTVSRFAGEVRNRVAAADEDGSTLASIFYGVLALALVLVVVSSTSLPRAEAPVHPRGRRCARGCRVVAARRRPGRGGRARLRSPRRVGAELPRPATSGTRRTPCKASSSCEPTPATAGARR